MNQIEDAAVVEMKAYEAARDAETLDDLLARWHDWQQGSRVTRGYDDRSSGVGEYQSSRQYDDMTGVLDDDLDAARSKQVDVEVQEMVHPYRTAIYIEARNLTLGLDVWQSPRLPPAASDREAIRVEARAQLTRRLKAAGVM